MATEIGFASNQAECTGLCSCDQEQGHAGKAYVTRALKYVGGATAWASGKPLCLRLPTGAVRGGATSPVPLACCATPAV